MARLRQAAPNSRAVMMTGHSEALYVGRTGDAGAYGYINKALDLPAIANCVERAAGFAVFPIVSGGRHWKVADEAAFQRLTKKELVVLRMLVSGSRPKDIAQALSIHTKAVSSYKTNAIKAARNLAGRPD